LKRPRCVTVSRLRPCRPGRVSAVKEWTAKLRLKYQLHNRGDHYEVELLALPKANGIAIRYTTTAPRPPAPVSPPTMDRSASRQLPHRLCHGVSLPDTI
jgi:hypothetical protein